MSAEPQGKARGVGRREALLGGAALLATAGSRSSFAQGAKPLTKVTLATAGDALHWYPAYVARAAGLFAAEGLDVDWVDVGSGTKQVASVLGGSALATPLGIQTAFQAASSGADLILVSDLFDRFAMQIVLSVAALAKTGIVPAMPIDEKAQRLKGTRIAITGVGSSTDAVIRSLLLKRGINPDTHLSIQPLGSPPAMQAALEKGVIDGYVLSSPFPEITESKKLGRIILDTLANDIPEMIGVPYSAMITSRRVIAEQPQQLAALVRALGRAMVLTRDAPAQAAKLAASLFPSVAPDIFAIMEPRYRAAAAPSPVFGESAFDKLLAWMAIGSPSQGELRFASVVDNQFAAPAARDLGLG